jgi:large conductance mechanosensitive channel
MSVIKEFKEFAMKGNVMDLAVGIIIGAAFGKVVSSIVGDVIMPPIGLALGGVNFTNLAVTLKEATAAEPAVLLRYGAFIQSIVDFLIVAFAIFMVIKTMNALKRKKEEAPAPPAPPSKEEVLLTQIRDAIQAKK